MYPTPQYLASLPTDPDALLAVLTAQVEESRGDWSIEHGLFDQVRDLFHRADPLISPSLRAAVYRALAKLDSVAATGQTFTLAGRSVYGIAQLERGERQQILFAAETGHMIGYGAEKQGPTGPGWFALWQHRVVDSVGVTLSVTGKPTGGP